MKSAQPYNLALSFRMINETCQLLWQCAELGYYFTSMLLHGSFLHLAGKKHVDFFR